MTKEAEIQVARDGEVIGSFSYHTASSKASFGTLRPSDYAYISKKGKWCWVHLYKALELYLGEFFDELGESELEKEVKVEAEKVKKFLKLYKKAFDNETDKKKLKEYGVKVVEYEELQKYLSGIKERIREIKAEEEAEDRIELEEEKKEKETELKEKVDDVVGTLKKMIEEAKIQPLGRYVEEVTPEHMSFDWWWEYKDVLSQFCKNKVDENTGKALWKAFRLIKLYKGELTALAKKIVKAKENTEYDKGKKEAEVFFFFLIKKGVWAK